MDRRYDNKCTLRVSNDYSKKVLMDSSEHFEFVKSSSLYSYFSFTGSVGEAAKRFREVVSEHEILRLRQDFEVVRIDGREDWGVKYPDSGNLFICYGCSEDEAKIIAKLLNENKAVLLRE
jgi:hypothetical protein